MTSGILDLRNVTVGVQGPGEFVFGATALGYVLVVGAGGVGVRSCRVRVVLVYILHALMPARGCCE